MKFLERGMPAVDPPGLRGAAVHGAETMTAFCAERAIFPSPCSSAPVPLDVLIRFCVGCEVVTIV